MTITKGNETQKRKRGGVCAESRNFCFKEKKKISIKKVIKDFLINYFIIENEVYSIERILLGCIDFVFLLFLLYLNPKYSFHFFWWFLVTCSITKYYQFSSFSRNRIKLFLVFFSYLLIRWVSTLLLKFAAATANVWQCVTEVFFSFFLFILFAFFCFLLFILHFIFPFL